MKDPIREGAQRLVIPEEYRQKKNTPIDEFLCRIGIQKTMFDKKKSSRHNRDD